MENVISKPYPSHEVTPNSLELLEPNEVINMDYMTFNGHHVLIRKCKSTRYVLGKETLDMSMETARETFRKYINVYDRPRMVVTDGGPAFQSVFLNSVQTCTSSIDITAVFTLPATPMLRGQFEV